MRINGPSLLAVLTVGGAALCNSAFAGNGRELLFSAPIQKIDQSLGTVTLLDQTFHSATDQLSVGQVANVYGVLGSDGSATDVVVNGTNTYGANGDPVFVKGVVTSSDPILGRVEVDGMYVDYSSQLAKPGFAAPNVGDVLEIAASQPAQKGVLIAIATGADAYAAGVSSGSTGIPGGVATLASSGTSAGASAAGMTGGGSATAGMTGGGSSAAGMTGGGPATAGMTGGGARVAGMTGGGR